MKHPAKFPSPRVFALMLGVIAVGSCWPLVACNADFHRLFLFQDEWDQLQQIDREGLWAWAVSMFGENFMPLGKLAWAGVLRASGGSYFAVIAGVWLTHALNVFLLGWLAVRRGCHPVAGVLAAVLFGYSATTVETMAWAVQWSNVLPLTFFLGALLLLDRFGRERAASLALHVGLLLLLLAAALSFVRGMFCGAALAAAALVPDGQRVGWRRRAMLFGVAVLPAVVVLVCMKLGGIGSGQAGRYTAETLGRAAEFALHTYAHNPIVNWWSGEPLAPWGLAGMALLKTAVIVVGLAWAPARLRPVLWVLVFFEAANDVALGLGRFHTGLGAAASSRYQYTSLFTLMPFVAAVASRGLAALERWPGWRRALAGGVPLAVGLAVTLPWPATMRAWSGWRGGDLRAALARPAEQAPAKLPMLDWISYEEAHAIMARHRLH